MFSKNGIWIIIYLPQYINTVTKVRWKSCVGIKKSAKIISPHNCILTHINKIYLWKILKNDCPLQSVKIYKIAAFTAIKNILEGVPYYVFCQKYIKPLKSETNRLTWKTDQQDTHEREKNNKGWPELRFMLAAWQIIAIDISFRWFKNHWPTRFLTKYHSFFMSKTHPCNASCALLITKRERKKWSSNVNNFFLFTSEYEFWFWSRNAFVLRLKTDRFFNCYLFNNFFLLGISSDLIMVFCKYGQFSEGLTCKTLQIFKQNRETYDTLYYLKLLKHRDNEAKPFFALT